MTIRFSNVNFKKITPEGLCLESGTVFNGDHDGYYENNTYDSIISSSPLPTLVVDENLKKLDGENLSTVFDEIIYESAGFIRFKDRVAREKFFAFTGKIQEIRKKKPVIEIFPILRELKISKIVKFKYIEGNYVNNIISISVLCLESNRDFHPTIFKTVFGFTPAESRLAMLLVNGNSVIEAAEELGVRISTVREQLSNLFAKTRTSRQPELVSVLSRLDLIAR